MIAIYLAPLYLLLNAYFLFRILKWLETCHVHFKKKWIKAVLIMIYAFFAFSILTAFLLPQGTMRRVMKLISNYWLGVLMYLALTVIIADLIRLDPDLSCKSRSGKVPDTKSFQTCWVHLFDLDPINQSLRSIQCKKYQDNKLSCNDT